MGFNSMGLTMRELVRTPLEAEALAHIDRIIKENEGQPQYVIRKALSLGYPYGMKRGLPKHKMWVRLVRLRMWHLFKEKARGHDKAQPDDDSPYFKHDPYYR